MNFKHGTKTLSFTSGKGGVGKTTLAANVAYKLARMGKKVLIFDADLGMANVDIFFGTHTEYNMVDVLEGRKKIREILMPLESNLFLVSGGHGMERLQNLDSFSRRSLLDSLSEIQDVFDYMVIDTSPGIAPNVLQMNAAAQLINVIITPDPASFADSYALIKVLHQKYRINHFSIVCNQVKNHEDGFYLFKRFQEVVQRFLEIGLDFMGSVPTDSQLRSANIQQRLVLKQDAHSDSSIAISQISTEISKANYRMNNAGGLRVFWEQGAVVA